jgi:membrane associated rhomboid family serine protease
MLLATAVLPSIFNRFGLNVDLNDILGMHYWESGKFSPAQLITYAFMHGGFFHLLFNMFALYMFGGILEHVWGPKRFLFYYFVTAIGAGLVQQLVWTIEFHSVLSEMTRQIASDPVNALAMIAEKNNFLNNPNFITIGASGAVFGLLLAFGWLFPEERLYLMFIPVPIKARIFVVIYGVVELTQGVANFSGDSVAHFAHLGGMLFGAILIMIWQKKRRF